MAQAQGDLDRALSSVWMRLVAWNVRTDTRDSGYPRLLSFLGGLHTGAANWRRVTKFRNAFSAWMRSSGVPKRSTFCSDVATKQCC